jgi:putative SOS response-associated peptidase YedK
MCNQYESAIGSRMSYEAVNREIGRLTAQRCFPGFRVPILRQDADLRLLDVAEWAFVPGWSRELPKIRPTNAKGETVATNGLFRAAFQHSRCLFPASYWIEYTGPRGSKIPHRLARQDGEPLMLAGIWSDVRIGEERHRTAAIITTAANPRAAEIHHRMPLVLAERDEEAWLDPATPLEIVTGLLRPADPSWLLITPDDTPPRRRATQKTLEI